MFVRSATQDQVEKLLKTRLPAAISESECMLDALNNLSDSDISVHEPDNEEGKRENASRKLMKNGSGI